MGAKKLIPRPNCAVIACFLMFVGEATAGSLPNFKLGTPDIASTDIHASYNDTSFLLTLSGTAKTFNNSSAGNLSSDSFFLSAFVDHSGKLIDNKANLQVSFGGKMWFESGGSDPNGPIPNSAPVSFGVAKSKMQFVFSQGFFGQSGSIPSSGTPIDVYVHLSPNFNAAAFGSTQMFNDAVGTVTNVSDTAVAAPLPKTIFVGMTLFGLVSVAFSFRRLFQQPSNLSA